MITANVKCNVVGANLCVRPQFKNVERISKIDRVYGGSELPPYTEKTIICKP